MSNTLNHTIGWIGTGVMGLSMCRRLMEAGAQVHVYTRTAAKAQSLVDAGAVYEDSPAAVAKHCDTIFTMVGYPADVEQVYFGENGILSMVRSDMLLVDMTTTLPQLAERIAADCHPKGAWFVDAPVSGGDVGARNGTLSIMIGGQPQAVHRADPFFQHLGKSMVHQGKAGAGQHTKMCNQITIAGTMIGVCESLLYGSRAGLDLETMLSSISSGAAGCWTLDNLAPRVLKRNFDPGFYIDHFIKDMEIALTEAARLDISLPGLALVNQLYRAVKAQGHGLMGTHALMLGLEQLSGINGDDN